MQRILRAVLCAVAATCCLSAPAAGQERSIRIRDFGARLIVASDGSLDVTEHLVVGFSGQWNGIVRDLSLRHRTAEGRPARLDVDIVSITDGAGQSFRVEEERKDNGWTRALRIWVPGASDADREVVIRYRVANAIRFFYAGSAAGELDELYWNVTGNAWTMPIDKAHARVVLPGGVTATRTAVYTGATGSVAADATIQRSKNEVDFTLQRGLSPYEGMTIGVGWPAGHIASRPGEARRRLASMQWWSPFVLPFGSVVQPETLS